MSDSISILNVLTDAIYERVLNTMVTDVQVENSAAGLVKVGKLQSDPTVAMKNILVRESEDTDPHEIFKSGDHGIEGFVHEVGGGVHWWRKFRLIFNLHYPNDVDLDSSRNRSNIILARAEKAIKTMDIPAVEDNFGESAFMVIVTKSHIRQSGGPGHFIWHGTIDLKFLTEKQ